MALTEALGGEANPWDVLTGTLAGGVMGGVNELAAPTFGKTEAGKMLAKMAGCQTGSNVSKFLQSILPGDPTDFAPEKGPSPFPAGETMQKFAAAAQQDYMAMQEAAMKGQMAEYEKQKAAYERQAAYAAAYQAGGRWRRRWPNGTPPSRSSRAGSMRRWQPSSAGEDRRSTSTAKWAEYDAKVTGGRQAAREETPREAEGPGPRPAPGSDGGARPAAPADPAARHPGAGPRPHPGRPLRPDDQALDRPLRPGQASSPPTPGDFPTHQHRGRPPPLRPRRAEGRGGQDPPPEHPADPGRPVGEETYVMAEWWEVPDVSFDLGGGGGADYSWYDPGVYDQPYNFDIPEFSFDFDIPDFNFDMPDFNHPGHQLRADARLHLRSGDVRPRVRSLLRPQPVQLRCRRPVQAADRRPRPPVV